MKHSSMRLASTRALAKAVRKEAIKDRTTAAIDGMDGSNPVGCVTSAPADVHNQHGFTRLRAGSRCV